MDQGYKKLYNCGEGEPSRMARIIDLSGIRSLDVGVLAKTQTFMCWSSRKDG